MLNPTLLLAAAIDADGYLTLPAPDAPPGGAARAVFWPGAHGELLQRIDRGPDAHRTSPPDGSPLDPAFFARCLHAALGSLTPDLFALRSAGGPFACPGAAFDRAREGMIRDAFTVYLTAFEERLI